MRLVKLRVSERKSVRDAHDRRAENLSVEAWSADLAMRRRLCNFLIVLFTLGNAFAGTLIVLHGVRVILLPTTVLAALIVVVFEGTPRMLYEVVKSVFKQ